MAVLCLGLLILVSVPGNRLDELLTVATSRDNTFEDIGTFAWRLSIYQTTLEGLSGRSWSELLIGSGTSSGADVALQTGFFQEENVNPNRCIHDEFLRCLWEWGLLGLSSFVLFLVATFRLCFKLIRETGCPQAWAWLAILGPLLIGLLVENVLADGSSPGGVAYCLVLASMAGALGPALSKVRAVQTTIGPARSAG
jgi:O-antigen ligase